VGGIIGGIIAIIVIVAIVVCYRRRKALNTLGKKLAQNQTNTTVVYNDTQPSYGVQQNFAMQPQPRPM
jgi:hypothetical protein